MNSLIFRAITKIVTPILMIFSLYLLLRGHQLPGGGFIAGLMTSAALVLIYLAFGCGQFQWRYRSRFFYFLFSGGLALSFLTGLSGLFVGGAFLKSGVAHVEMPLIHESWEFASAAVFDVGVYLVVIGVCVSLMTQLGEEK
ncbi:MAG: MnhB domain-containing protein [Nitrospiria bacterium]